MKRSANTKEVVNEIYLRRKNKLFLPPIDKVAEIYDEAESKRFVSTMLQNFNGLGYTFSKELFDGLVSLPTYQIELFYFSTIGILRRLLGADKVYRPMYPNFPQQVMDASECELFLNAIVHYWSGGTIVPDYEKKERFPLLDQTKLKTIDLGTSEDFVSIIRNLLSSTTSISASDKEDITSLFEVSSPTNIESHYLPEEIPMKETVAFVTGLLMKNHPLLTLPKVAKLTSRYFKTATDVLRLAVALSDGDVSLASKTKFRTFKRPERRFLMALLDSCGSIEEDMIRYKEQWKRLAEKIHPSEYTEFPRVIEAFDKLRKDVKIQTFGGKVRRATDTNNVDAAVELLKDRPGEFARRLDHLLRMSKENGLEADHVLIWFDSVAKDVAVPVLLQVLKHFKERSYQSSIRTFFPKGNTSKMWSQDNNLPAINPELCNRVVKICTDTLIELFKERKDLGKVYIDPILKDYLVPFSQRSASKALRTIVRGSKPALSVDAKTIRAYIWWKEPYQERTDLDLSAILYDEDWNYVNHISYTSLRQAGMGWHSGDIVSAPNGAFEAIDIDIERVRESGKGRYVAFQVYSFTHTPFIQLPECFMGWMERQHQNSGEIFEPKTLVNRVDITADSQTVIPMILDVEEMKMIWADIAGGGADIRVNNVERHKITTAGVARAISSLKKINLYELFELHCAARGTLCVDKSEADTIFSLEEGITPYDIDVIMSQFM